MATKTKVWFTSVEMVDAGFTAGSPNAQGFRDFARKHGWGGPEQEGSLWRHARYGGRRVKLWHLGAVRDALRDALNDAAARAQALRRDPAWRTVDEIALLDAPWMTRSTPSIRARLECLGLMRSAREGRAWRYRERIDLRKPAMEFSLGALLAALRKEWMRSPPKSPNEQRTREKTLQVLTAALFDAGSAAAG